MAATLSSSFTDVAATAVESTLRDRARIFVESWAKVQAGERVLVLADETADPAVARAVVDSARATGADVTFVEMPRPTGAWSEPSDVVFGAMRRAQKCLSLALVYHDPTTTRARREHGMAMFFLLPPVPQTLLKEAALFPIELCAEIGLRCARRLRAAREIRVTSARGTDFHALLDPRNCTADPGGWLEAWDPGRTVGTTPGEGSNSFPPGVVLAYPDPGTTEGVAVFEHFVGAGPTRDLAVRYAGGRAVEASGDGADAIAERLRGVPHAADVAEIAWGTNPLQTLMLETERNPVDAERHSGTVHVGIGPSPIFGARTTSAIHLDGLILRPTIELDGEPIMEDGHLLVLDEPDVRELASRFGDPDDLLTERWEPEPAWVLELDAPPLDGEWIRLAEPGEPEPRDEAAREPTARQLELVRGLVERVRATDEGRWLLSLYRFNIEVALPGGETCHVPIDHGAVEVVGGAAPGERLLTVRIECDEQTLEDLAAARVGPVEANVSGRLWVSGSLGTRVLTSCTFRFLRIAQDAAKGETG